MKPTKITIPEELKSNLPQSRFGKILSATPVVMAVVATMLAGLASSEMTRAQYDASATLRGSDFVGSPEQVVEKILFQYEIFKHERFLVQFTVGSMPHEKIMHSIELFGTKVAPVVRAEIARRTASVGAPS